MFQNELLRKWLCSQSAAHITMTFDQIEEILGRSLPHSARMRARWWQNEKPFGSHNTQCKAWVDAGFYAKNLDLSKETVDFVRYSQIGESRTKPISQLDDRV